MTGRNDPRSAAPATAPADGVASHQHEQRRLEVLERYAVMDTPPERAFDDLALLAAQVCGTAWALVSFVASDRQWCKATYQFKYLSTGRKGSFCGYTVSQGSTMIVEDTHQDPRFMNSPVVLSDPKIRFYAGAPLLTAEGYAIGALCVLHPEPATLSNLQVSQLEALARQVVDQLELRRQAAELAQEAKGHLESRTHLDHSKRLLNGILDHSDLIIFAKDLDGRFLLVNHALEQVLGLAKQDMLGRTDRDLFAEAEAERYELNDRDTHALSGPTVFREQVLHADGSWRELRSTKFALRDAAGEPYAVAGVSTDVTELAEQRRAHEAAEQRWRALVEQSPVGVAVVDAQARFVYANPHALRLYGATSEAELIGRSLQQMSGVQASDRDQIEQLLTDVRSGRLLIAKRLVARRLDDQVVDVEVNAALVDYDGSRAVQLELRDMTEQVAAEKAIRMSERRWRALISDSPVGIALADESGTLLSANTALATFFGRTEEELVGRRTAEFLDHDGPDVPDNIHAGPDASAAVRAERRYRRSDGSLRWGWLTKTQSIGPQGERWTLIYVEDVTDRKLAEKEIRISQANLSAVAAVVKQIQSGNDARDTIVQAAHALAHADYAILFEPAPHGVHLKVTATTELRIRDTTVPLHDGGVAAAVFRTGAPQFISDTSDRETRRTKVDTQRTKCLYVVPVRSGGAVTAVLIVGWAHSIPDLDDRRASVVTLLADHAGVALRQANLLADLEELAVTDPLTTLPNRRGWDKHLEVLFALAKRGGRPLTVALADLDHFKRYNDTNGHLAGDTLLRDFASAGRAALRTGDVLARWGGEEFALALPDCTDEDAELALDRLMLAVPDRQTCSLGYATWNGRESAATLMDRVDQALYTAKRSGRNCMREAA